MEKYKEYQGKSHIDIGAEKRPEIKYIMDEYGLYLRKSRADIEAEARGEGETLARHERNLLELARKMGVNIKPENIFREVVSGESIEHRPVMQEVLQLVEDGKFKGIFVMEIERLARGDTVDQGIIAQTFKYSGTKIITPTKIYDPNNEFDEEYFEFGLFMSRREYKTINRRQQAGRMDSVKEGKFIGNIPPYGYLRRKLEKEKGYTLVPHPDQAPVIKMIFDMYVNQGMGTSMIANKLNELKIPTAKNSVWVLATINGIIRNPVYYGVIAGKRRPQVKARSKGVVTKTRPRVDRKKWVTGEGLHEPLVSKEIWDKAQEIMGGRSHAPAPTGVITSSLAGLVRCELCGRLMVRRPYNRNQPPSLICVTPTCTNVSSAFDLVEDRILEGLSRWLENYKAEWESAKGDSEGIKNDESLIAVKEAIVQQLHKKIDELRRQSGNLDDLLEQKIYSLEKYMERSQVLATRIAEAEEALESAIKELQLEKSRRQAKVDIIPKVQHVLDTYPKTDDPALRNELLKSVLEGCTYKKTVRGHWSRPDSMKMFDLTLYPKLPRSYQ
ncbi:recombinase family protein [Paenibacillus sp. VCA1]|uniref:recombinase family protein n=1 Tax=Paenibacillus sp. VCA1 TaxID=3039148 RepID=UPI00287186C9|nr:recombinase family protein [Paenibacillus sp. VCA1]MDR9857835.1 recombinase family protein [Paenibacillus sp. VCA1]